MADLEDYNPQTATIQRYQLSTGKWRIELVIHTFAITSSLAMVLIAMSLAVQGMCLSIILLSGPAGLSILWNITKVIYVAKSVDHRSSHPVAAVALDLVLCVGFLVVSSMILVSYRAATINNRQGRTDVPAGSYGRSIAEGALMIINGILHFILLAYACYRSFAHYRVRSLLKDTDVQQRKSLSSPL